MACKTDLQLTNAVRPERGARQIWLVAVCEKGQKLRITGSPARIAPNILVTHDPELLRHMSAPRAGWKKSSWYAAARFDPRINSVFSETDDKIHNELRAIEIGAVRHTIESLALR